MHIYIQAKLKRKLGLFSFLKSQNFLDKLGVQQPICKHKVNYEIISQ